MRDFGAEGQLSAKFYARHIPLTSLHMNLFKIITFVLFSLRATAGQVSIDLVSLKDNVSMWRVTNTSKDDLIVQHPREALIMSIDGNRSNPFERGKIWCHLRGKKSGGGSNSIFVKIKDLGEGNIKNFLIRKEVKIRLALVSPAESGKKLIDPWKEEVVIVTDKTEVE